MQIKQRLLILVALFVIAMSMLLACSGPSSETKGPAGGSITVNNDSVLFSDLGSVGDPDAGETDGEVTSGGVAFDSLGIAASPDPYIPPSDFESLILGNPPAISHGSTNGEMCLNCHNAGAGGAPILAPSHVEAGLTDDYCRNCHLDV